jgi:hypothetical protein
MSGSCVKLLLRQDGTCRWDGSCRREGTCRPGAEDTVCDRLCRDISFFLWSGAFPFSRLSARGGGGG